MAFEEMASVVSITMWVFISIMALAAGSMAAKKKHYPALVIIIIAFVLGILFAGGISLAASIIYLVWASSQEKKANAATAVVAAQTANVSTQKVSSKEKPEETEEEPVFEKKIKCRFCKKLYSSEYNGCPYCKKK